MRPRRRRGAAAARRRGFRSADKLFTKLQATLGFFLWIGKAAMALSCLVWEDPTRPHPLDALFSVPSPGGGYDDGADAFNFGDFDAREGGASWADGGGDGRAGCARVAP